MNVSILNYSDTDGGAARAAYRIHQALQRKGLTSRMLVNDSNSGDWSVEGPRLAWRKTVNALRPYAGRIPIKLLQTENRNFHSSGIISSHWPQYLNQSDADVVHLHWINNEMMSVSDIGRLRKPIVWTLHDMWAFCGAEHYTEDSRWREGYAVSNRPGFEGGFDVNRWTWRRKLKHWTRPMHIVTPSRWLSDCVRQSALMRDWPVFTIPNAIDITSWQPINKSVARQMLSLPSDMPLLLFGALGGGNDHRKGFDLLLMALDFLRGHIPDMELLVLGQSAPEVLPNLGFAVHFLGHMTDDISLRLLYSAADVLVIPSRQDNLPNMGIESQSCGTPVLAFDACGLPDVVDHKKTGYLANAYDPEDLARGVLWLFDSTSRLAELSRNARERARTLWSYDVVASQYAACYELAASLCP